MINLTLSGALRASILSKDAQRSLEAPRALTEDSLRLFSHYFSRPLISYHMTLSPGTLQSLVGDVKQAMDCDTISTNS